MYFQVNSPTSNLKQPHTTQITFSYNVIWKEQLTSLLQSDEFSNIFEVLSKSFQIMSSTGCSLSILCSRIYLHRSLFAFLSCSLYIHVGIWIFQVLLAQAKIKIPISVLPFKIASLSTASWLLLRSSLTVKDDIQKWTIYLYPTVAASRGRERKIFFKSK